MPTIKYKPTTPSRRNMTAPTFEEITKFTPEKSLIEVKKKHSGRNSYGKITVRHRGGGNKVKYRIVDFKRQNESPATVIGIEYDPNRSAYIALLQNEEGEKSYILAPVGLKDGDKVYSGNDADIKPGNTLEIAHIPVGTLIHNIEIKPGHGGQMVRSAGTAAQLMAKEGAYAQVRLPSGEVRKVLISCRATIGQVGNPDHENVRIGKAGKQRHKGIRPSVRGVVMNPVDHPHGGGEGRSPVGMPAPMSPWGKPTQGVKTRKHRKYSDKLIVKKAAKR